MWEITLIVLIYIFYLEHVENNLVIRKVIKMCISLFWSKFVFEKNQYERNIIFYVRKVKHEFEFFILHIISKHAWPKVFQWMLLIIFSIKIFLQVYYIRFKVKVSSPTVKFTALYLLPILAVEDEFTYFIVWSVTVLVFEKKLMKMFVFRSGSP